MTINYEQTVLIVDDMEANISLLRQLLAPLNINLLTATSGVEALRKIDAHEVDLLLLDVHMPDMTGFDVAKALQDDDDYNEIPVIFITASDKFQDEFHRLKGYEYGAVEYIQKPIDSETLRAKVKVFLRLSQQEKLLLIIFLVMINS